MAKAISNWQFANGQLPIAMLSPADAERFNRICRETQRGYGITLKDLGWLVRLTEKLIAASGQLPTASAMPPVKSDSPALRSAWPPGRKKKGK